MAAANTTFDPKWLRTPNSRADKLKARPKPFYVWIAPGTQLGYRRNATGGGSWCVRDRTDGNDRLTWLAQADDGMPENPPAVLGYTKAVEAAQKLARAPAAKGEKPEKRKGPITVYDALGDCPTARDPQRAYTGYAADLKRRGGDPYNARRARVHVKPSLGNRAVALLTKSEMQKWVAELEAKRAAATVNRTITCLLAALEIAAADPDNHIAPTTMVAIRAGLAKLDDAHEARNIILDDDARDRLVDACYAHDRKLGIFADVMDETGARPGQIARLLVRDLVLDPDAPRLTMPKSGKGGSRSRRAERKRKRYSLPISPELAAILAAEAKGRKPTAFLLTRANGETWSDDPFVYYGNPVQAIIAKLDLPAGASMYSLRHSHVVQMLKDNTPVRIIAVLHDSSVAQIERSYSVRIDEHVDEIARKTLRRRKPAAGERVGNVVKLDARR